MTVKISIDNKETTVNEGETILSVLKRNGVYVPHICYNEGLTPIESCDSCLVEVNGRLVRACSTKVSDGMNVLVNSPRAVNARKTAISRILRYHKLYCSICENNNGDCVLQAL